MPQVQYVVFMDQCTKCWIAIRLFVYLFMFLRTRLGVELSCEAGFYMQTKVPSLTVHIILQFNNNKRNFQMTTHFKDLDYSLSVMMM